LEQPGRGTGLFPKINTGFVLPSPGRKICRIWPGSRKNNKQEKALNGVTVEAETNPGAYRLARCELCRFCRRGGGAEAKRQEACMLREITNARQAQDEPKKRWFSSLNMDLFVWFNDDEEIISYHLTYNKPHDEKALTWSKEKGFLHLDVDDGRRPGKHPGSPLLVQDGAIQPKKIVAMLKENQTELEASIMNFIVSGIEEGFY
jgi:hypothetical protein